MLQEQEALLQTMYKVKLFVDIQTAAQGALLHVHVLSSHPGSLAKVALRIKQEVAAWTTWYGHPLFFFFPSLFFGFTKICEHSPVGRTVFWLS